MNSDTNASGSSRRKIVIVHGRDFKPAREELLNLVDLALAAGIERDYPELLSAYQDLAKELAYYGDITNALLIENGGTYDEQLDVGDRRNAYYLLRKIDKRKKFTSLRYDNLPGKSAIPEFVADVAGPVLGAVGAKTPLIAKKARDVKEYWNAGSDFGPRVRQRISDALCAALDETDKLLLISHGTGCIATYDVLWQLSYDPEFAGRYSDRKIDTWVTLGAPLGDNIVQKNLFGAKEKTGMRYPHNILSWHNVSAEDDYCCHDNTLADDFKAMLNDRLVSSIRDYQIYNLAIRYGKSNPHSSVGYYIHPRVSQLVVSWLTQDSEA